MKSTLNNACISALLCGVVLVAIPAMAAGTVGGPAGTGDAVGGTVNSTGTVGTPPGELSNNPATHNTASSSTTWHGNTSGPGGTDPTVSHSSDINTATAGNNAGSVNTQTAINTRIPSRHMSHKVRVNAYAAEVETTRQLNQQARASR
jgi:hypothetical protein